MEGFDFSGYATKAGLKCSDGRIITKEAFAHQDKVKVPLVWQHGHDDPENILGHAVLEARDDGIYTYCYFNKTPKAQHAKESVEHKDITQMSIWANQLAEKTKVVMHGVIREVSLVIGGANPGALIDNVVIRHSDDPEDIERREDMAVITTGLDIELAHSDTNDDGTPKTEDTKSEDEQNDDTTKGSEEKSEDDVEHATGSGKTLQEVLDTFNEEQMNALKIIVGTVAANAGGDLKQDDLGEDGSVTTDDKSTDTNDSKGTGVTTEIKHNVFENDADGSTKKEQYVLSHDDMKTIVSDAKVLGTMKAAVEKFADAHLEHGIEDIDILFPDAQFANGAVPEMYGRRTEWVNTFLSGVRKVPFSKIKTLSADITVAEARAKGYIKGTLKKEEFFRVSRRTTGPTTIYKKQKLDRDDLIDITDFDVVVWLKAEMRLMLDEEIARACLVGDGRAPDDDDKIDEESIRPIASDHEVFVTTLYVNLDAEDVTIETALDRLIADRRFLRGSGTPVMFTKETYIGQMLLLRDNMGRKKYSSLQDVASEHRVSAIVPVEILEETPYNDLVFILVNLNDYVIGATAGGQVSLFDDFDIDYNQYKYLIETRIAGALVKMKSALVVRRTAANAVLRVPVAPAFDGDGITITNQTGVVFRNKDTDAVLNAAGSPYAVADGQVVTVTAEPADSSSYFSSSNDDEWRFTGEA